jgi:uncharacterized lipoprotein NlpE involved in copper resistance
MKKIVCVLSVMAVSALVLISCKPKNESQVQENQTIDIVDPDHSSQNSLDWAGVYTGTTPCADCSGIKVRLVLNADETYQLSYQYLGKGDGATYTVSGQFTWDEVGDVIKLDCMDYPPYYSVGEGKLIQLDMEGDVIIGEFADKYVLLMEVQ